MTKNKKIYKYISVISLLISIALIANLIIPSFTMAQGENVTITEGEEGLVITTKVGNANLNKSRLYVIKAENLTIPNTQSQLESFANDHVNELKGTITQVNQTFTHDINGTGKYYAVVLLMEEKQLQDQEGNPVTSTVYTEAISNSYTVNSGEDNTQTGGEGQGTSQGEGQGTSQGEGQGTNQGEGQGTSQGEGQTTNQGGNQTQNQEINKEDDDVLQVRIEDKDENQNNEDYTEIQPTNTPKTDNTENLENGNTNKNENQNDNQNQQNVNNIQQNNTKAVTTENKNNNAVKVVTKNTESKSQENIPQTGANETGLIVAIAVFALISLGSFIKYRKA